MLELALWVYLLPAPPPCVAEVRWPGLPQELPSWAFVTPPPRPCEDLRPSAAWMYHFVDPAEPTSPEEYQGDIYKDEIP